MKKRMVIITITVIILIILIGMYYLFSKKNWIECKYPQITNSIIEEIEFGKHTSYFNPTDVLYSFLNEKYPDYASQIDNITEKKNEIIYDVSFSHNEEKFSLKIKLKKINLKDTDYYIWMVVEYALYE